MIKIKDLEYTHDVEMIECQEVVGGITFFVGYAIGKALDKKFKLSEKVADGLCSATGNC